MSANKSRKERIREAAEYWNAHGIDEAADEGEEVEVEVKTPLSAVLSLRLDPKHLNKLKLLARAQDTGVTTMARRILCRALDEPGNQLVLQALSDASLSRDSLSAGPQIPPDEATTDYYLISRESLEHIERLVYETAHRLFIEALREKSVSITPHEGELYDRARKMAEAHS